MSRKSKTYISVFLAIAVVGALAYKSSNSNLFKGQLTSDTSPSSQETELPDLSVKLSVVAPTEEGGDLGAQVTITNEGPGSVSGETPFKYTISIGDSEVFSNVDSYTFMEAGDAFSFIYPISRTIYQYPNEGQVKATVDTDNNIRETNEENNNVEVGYFL